MRIVYGDLAIDTDRLVITRAGVDVHVQPQVFDVLTHLLTNRDRVVTKEELLDQIWGDRFVSESALTSRIKSARQLVGDDGISQRVIKTVHGRGYRWIADIEVVVSAQDAAGDGSLLSAADFTPPRSASVTGGSAVPPARRAAARHRTGSGTDTLDVVARPRAPVRR